MLLANYASDSDSDNEAGPASKPVAAPAKLPAPAKGKKRAGPIKITLDLPKSGSKQDRDEPEEGEPGDDADGDVRGAKKAKIGSGPNGGKGSSSLLGMLPPPKRKLPTAIPSGSALGVNKAMAVKPKLPVPTSSLGNLGGGIVDEDDEDDDKAVAGPSSSMMLPPTMARKVKKKEEEEVPLDLFGLSSAPTPSIPSSSSQTALKPPQITSAPAVADFIPPPPTPEDPYPGYYQLPGGQWAAYDPEYYHGFFAQAREDAAAAEEEDAGGRMGKHWADYDQSAELQNIQASEGISEAKAAEARRQTAMPKRNREEFDYKPVGQVKGLATERHQLSSLLNVAFTQRDALEDRIAENKKSARMAKTKYGF